MGRRSSLHEDFVRVKTPMGLERFQVGTKLRPNSQSLGNHEGIGFGTEKNFSVSLLAQEGIQIKNCFGTIEGQLIGLNCSKSFFLESKLLWVYSDLKFNNERFFRVRVRKSQSCFKSGENRGASSLWVGGHFYAGDFCMSKLIWV